MNKLTKRILAMTAIAAIAVTSINFTPKADAVAAVTPENPFVSTYVGTEGKSVWDTVYFGNYWQRKCDMPKNAPQITQNTVWTDTETNQRYLLCTDGNCFLWEPIKWRILQTDGKEAFLMADQTLDWAKYDSDECIPGENDTEEFIPWEECDLRAWLNDDTTDGSGFYSTAFTDNEKEAIKEVTVDNTTANPETGLTGGNDTTDKIYLLSVNEALTPQYGFSSDRYEAESRASQISDYVNLHGGTFMSAAGNELQESTSANTYWLRSPGISATQPAIVGHWSDAEVMFSAEGKNDDSFALSAILPKSNAYVGVRPVLHLDLSNTSLWSYAGKVTADGNTWTKPAATPVPTVTPAAPAKKATVTPIKLSKPVIKKMKNVSGRKVKVTLKKKDKSATGYQVAYATNSKFKKKKLKKFTKTSVTIKKLKKKKYYFKVRAYKKSGNTVTYSKWSKVKSIKVKK